ncbi:MAG: 7-cyano-7-deazaguanine synthase QueC [Epsilonproteobacteria bacterium]|nr:MAG: 7-cyano-7-deazaguanine synthase QueC [Campylobacterota bacterium]
MNRKVLLLLSGGLDSTILLYKLVESYGRDNVTALTFNYGQKHAIELQKAKTSTVRHGVGHKFVDISFLGDMVKDVSAMVANSSIDTPHIKEVLGDPQTSTYVPFRNQILSSLAFAYAEANDIDSVYLSIQAQDSYSYWDTSAEFVKRFNGLASLNRKVKIELKTPFVDMSKSDEINLGVKLGVNFIDTWTCYRGAIDSKACGTCASCSERLANFAKSGIKDPIEYEIEINWQQMFDLYHK